MKNNLNLGFHHRPSLVSGTHRFLIEYIFRDENVFIRVVLIHAIHRIDTIALATPTAVSDGDLRWAEIRAKMVYLHLE